MARNKYPEETIKKILDISLRLFESKGYEKTSIQDIVEQLGMSKGAIYHHFKNKEEILERLCHQVYYNLDWYKKICQDKVLNGMEKLRQMFLFEISDRQKVTLDVVTQPSKVDPRMLMEHVKMSVEAFAPMLRVVIEQGVQDGSIHTMQPREASEVIILLMNLWVNPVLFRVDRERFLAKMKFYGQLLDGVGIPLIDEMFMESAMRYYDQISSR